jgi:hypothetical protein
MNWQMLVNEVLRKEPKSFAELKAPFKFRDLNYFAYGDATVSLSEAEVKLYSILDEDNNEILNPLPEMIRDAQYALQDHANYLAK